MPNTIGVPRVSRARGQSHFERPHPACSRQRRCEEWVEKTGCRKLTRDPNEWLFLNLFENFIWLWRQDLWIVEIMNYRRVNILIVSRSYPQLPISNFAQEWTFKLLYCDIPNQWRGQKFWWGGKWLEVTDWGGQKSETSFPSLIYRNIHALASYLLHLGGYDPFGPSLATAMCQTAVIHSNCGN